MQQQVRNASAKPWTGQAYRQLQRIPLVLDSSGIGIHKYRTVQFHGAAWYSPEKFRSLPSTNSGEPLKQTVSGGWVAMLQHYFFAAWIPPANEVDEFSSAQVAAADGTLRDAQLLTGLEHPAGHRANLLRAAVRWTETAKHARRPRPG